MGRMLTRGMFRHVFGIALLLLIPSALRAQNAKCPIMTDMDGDTEITVEYEGKKVLFCCDKCGRLWQKNPKYIIKAAGPEILPQFKDMQENLGLDKVELLPQRFCPVRQTWIVTPDSPTVDYKGVKVYLFDDKAVARWKTDPDSYAKKAIEAGLLPQLALPK